MSRLSVGVVVALALGAFGSGCVANSPPLVTVGPRPNSLVVESGGELAMQLEVSDPDGDKMSYFWTQIPADPAGHFSDARTRNPTWRAPVVSETMSFTITVTVTDEEGGGVLGTSPSVVVQVR
ncbi:hypothetical protein HPC49_53670 [Pyxidicoccus fallax]|uniref:PKD domain-containing protein n=1 Tax=Pyxidicoccus fallax TaxID=394095 RepID=A0A848LC13_9BACT|nr:hypothetical protein [Pyxidicoccus fallax]NMO16479.1 hypothetical protein [Pyxidicoccus fallax]NPC87018.1 hypothetical protein [Pyxidicoccus fallax]